MNKQIIVYTTSSPFCSNCFKLKVNLNSKKIQFTEIDMAKENDQETKDRFNKAGYMSYPVVEVRCGKESKFFNPTNMDGIKDLLDFLESNDQLKMCI